ncbi:hypothetical protein VP01_4230g1 [Puccinia sorghi]|uniref:glutathione-specific gamma-glutamylcyclotransferase n=1 Tax=Puccinia sorghi TaxID=27349 RepID=A0A0L6UQI8_9BASI|nr:hypothetical protein VP01_4230g1 [Puccinia sorghi]
MTAVETAGGNARYGSLIWRPPPFVIDRTPCYVKGYTRRFAQLSHDHRGTPEEPGVVVTLIPSAEWKELAGAGEGDGSNWNKVWGVVYTIEPGRASEVQAYLDEREKDGYELMEVEVFVLDQDQGQEQCAGKTSVYVGHTTNPSFRQPTTLDQLAAQIHKSAGPSGPNKASLCFHSRRAFLFGLPHTASISEP